MRLGHTGIMDHSVMLSCDDTALTFSLLQQNAHYMLDPVGLSKLWEKLLFISGELRFKTSTAILKQKSLRRTAYGWPCATFSLPTKFKHQRFHVNVK